jgi:hypothetical protein
MTREAELGQGGCDSRGHAGSFSKKRRGTDDALAFIGWFLYDILVNESLIKWGQIQIPWYYNMIPSWACRVTCIFPKELRKNHIDRQRQHTRRRRTCYLYDNSVR